MKRAVAAALLWLASAVALAAPGAVARAAPARQEAGAARALAPAPGAFDYYLLALSWSPTHCAAPGAAQRDPFQCHARRGFITHGLWPQYERGFPRNCAVDGPRRAPAALAREQLDLMPGLGLIDHEWSAHGACTGLTPAAYFAAVRTVRAMVVIPSGLGPATVQTTTTVAAVRAEFVKANRGMSPMGLAVICDHGALSEVRICFTKTATLRMCGRDVNDRCPYGAITVPAAGPR